MFLSTSLLSHYSSSGERDSLQLQSRSPYYAISIMPKLITPEIKLSRSTVPEWHDLVSLFSCFSTLVCKNVCYFIFLKRKEILKDFRLFCTFVVL